MALAFAPVVGGVITLDLNITTNAPADGTVNLRVIKDRPPVRVLPLTLNFGSVQIGAQDTLKTTILNPQILNFAVTQLKFVRNQPFSLVGQPTLPDTVRANGGARILTVQFTPTTSGSFVDTLQIMGATQTFKVVLSGTGLRAQAQASVDSLRFGTVDVGADSVQSFTLSNTGEVALVLGNVIVEGAQFAITDTLAIPDTLGVGQSHVLGVRYTPNGGGIHQGNVRVTLGNQTVRVNLRGTGLAPPRVTAGPIALDLDLTVGDQAVRERALTGRSVTVDLAVTEGALGTAGFNVVLAFDSTAVAFSEFTLVDLYDGATPIVTRSGDRVEFSVVFLGTATASRQSGSAGHARFTLLGGASATQIRIVTAAYATAGGSLPIEIGSDGARVTVQGSVEPSADFNGDGEIGFADFILFAGKFGTKQGDANFDAAFDLNGNGSVDFPDFITFAGKFGTKTNKPVLSKPVSK